MAYYTDTGTYTDADNAMAIFYAWANTRSWTQEGTVAITGGHRYHISKTINGLDCYFNFAAGLNLSGAGLSSIDGIIVNGSTGYNSGSDWDEQPGYTTEYGDTATKGGCIDDVTTGGTYYVFASDTTLTLVLLTASTHNDWRTIIVGECNGAMFYAASGGNDSGSSASSDDRSALFASISVGLYDGDNNSHGIYIPGDDWYTNAKSTSSSWQAINHCRFDGSTSDSYAGGSLSHPIMVWSPDGVRGNAPLAPIQLAAFQTSAVIKAVGEVDGIRAVNMKYISNGEVINYGSDYYRCFRMCNVVNFGYAYSIPQP
jgi:hypothetical protein